MQFYPSLTLKWTRQAVNVTLPLIVSLGIGSCTSANPTRLPQIVSVRSTSAAQPWLSDLYVCANEQSVILSVSPDRPDIELRLGEPEDLSRPAYQIDEEQLVIVTDRESPLQNLTLDEARELFGGMGNPSIQVWVYPSGEDVQLVFEQLVMKNGAVSSFARVAMNPQEMSDELNSGTNEVGILPRHWQTDALREIYALPAIPVLAVTNAGPMGIIQPLIGCLQN